LIPILVVENLIFKLQNLPRKTFDET